MALILESHEPAILPPQVFQEGTWFRVMMGQGVLSTEVYVPAIRRELSRWVDREGRAAYILELPIVVTFQHVGWLGEDVGRPIIIRDYLACGASKPLEGWEVYDVITPG